MSEYTRAQETAALLNLKNSKVAIVLYSYSRPCSGTVVRVLCLSANRRFVEFYLREQDKGIFGGKSHKEREAEYAEQLARLKKDTFYVAPPGGESIANSCLRVDRIISLWQTSCPGGCSVRLL